MDKVIWIHFDGGHRKEHGGVGGFVAFDPKGYCVGGMSLYFGSRAKTSNEAELLALERTGKWIESSTTIAAGSPWILIGDSEIAINFLLGRYKPNKTLFTSIVREIKQMAIRMKWPYGYKHVPRTQNEFADWLA